MENVTLQIARIVVDFLNKYRGPLELEALIEAAILSTNVKRADIIAVLDFINEIKHVQPVSTTSNTPIVVDTTKPLDLMDELHYTYQVAKKLLTDELQKGTHDTEEVRKNLREISRFMDSALKMQERLYNVQQIQKFQESVLQLLDSIDPAYRATIVATMLDGDI